MSQSSPKKALVIELNSFHGECLPGFIKYLTDLGYQPEVLINQAQKKEHPLAMFDSQINVSYESLPQIIKFINSPQLENYDLCLFNSNIVYGLKSNNILDLLLTNHAKKVLCVEHHIENITPQLLQKTDILVLKQFSPDCRLYEVNPHYFGTIHHHIKNATTQFVTAGNIQSTRKNHGLLITAVQALVDSGHTDFHITVIGKGNIENLPDNLKTYFTFTGRIAYDTMYDIIASSDYFLPLLDPENKEHDRYITQGTSGSFQLIYGLNIPCIIAKKFADIHNFTSKNSIIYKDNASFTNALITAMNQSSDAYTQQKQELQKTANTIYQSSLSNLNQAIVNAPLLSQNNSSLTAYIQKKKLRLLLKKLFQPNSVTRKYYLFGFIPLFKITTK